MSDRYNRRAALAGLGGVSLSAVLAACGSDADPSTGRGTTGAAPTAPGAPARSAASAGLVSRFDRAAVCAQTTEQTEGPFYFEVDRIRSDIDEGREGVPLRLGIRVRDLASCEPIPDAVVDVWHCDARGLYSGFEAASQGAGDGRSDGETYLRGAQVTDRNGIVEFRTIYPGAYPGRTPHVHTKVHLDRTTLLTSQLYFDDAVTARVHARPPYAGDGDTANGDDGFHAPELEVTLSEEREGWLGLFTFDVRRA